MSGLKFGYLLSYNALSSALWAAILHQAVGDVIGSAVPDDYWGPSLYVTKTYDGFPHKFLVEVQVFNAVVEITNTLLGLVKSPLSTVLLQFTARLMITVGISYKLPTSPGNFHLLAYTTLALSWSLTEILRYTFYVFKLVGYVPYSLLWARYTTFFLLYPLGLLSESYVVWLSLGTAKGTAYYYFLCFAIAVYIPGFLILYSYMIKQRRKVLDKVKGIEEEKSQRN